MKDNEVRLTFKLGDAPSNTFFKSNGEVRGVYIEGKKEFEGSMNKIVISLYNELKRKT